MILTFLALIPNVYYNVKQYGALGNGSNDDSSSIASAISAASAAGGGVVFFPVGTYITGNQTLVSNVILQGAGIGATTLKLKNGANTDLLSAQTSSINLSAAANSGIVGSLVSFSIRDMVLNGNKANQTAASYCLRFYGYNFLLQNVEVTNTYSDGALIDWNGGSFIGSGPEMESLIDTCKFHDCGGIGLRMGGPHDSRWNNTISFGNGSHNFHIAPNANGILATDCHGYDNPNTANVVDYLIEATGCQFSNCVAEGSYHCDVVLLGNNTSWTGGNIYNGASSSTAIGMQLGQQSGQTPYSGQILQSAGVTTASQVGNCCIETMFNGYVAASINFANETNNSVSANIYQTSGTAISGTPSVNDYYNLVVRGLTPDGSTGKGGGLQVVSDADIALSLQSANGLVYHVDRFGNLYMNGGINTAAGFYFTASTTTNSLASSGTISVQGLSDIVVAPTANVNGVIMQQGYGGQVSVVANASAFSIQFAASGTSNMANGVAEVIPPNSGKVYFFDSTNNLWYGVSTVGMASASAATIASSGTITTAGVDQARVTTSGAVTGVILQAGTYANQACVVVNESANSITFAAVGTSNVADGTSAVIAANRMMVFRWDSGTSKWYHA
jgi:hypothetical protein